MDGTALILYLIATFVGGVTTGLAGFAFGLVVSGIWLHVMTPLQAAALIIGYGFIVQPYSIWKMRRSVNLRSLVPLLIGSAIGVPIGAALLAFTDPDYLRVAIGVILIAYSLWGLATPAVKKVKANAAAETAVGISNGIIGGMTGLSGIIITIWCQLRGLPKDAQRGIYQPVIMASFIMTGAWLVAAGTIPPGTLTLYLYGMPLLVAGMFIGMKLYTFVDDMLFRRIVLALLLISGVALVIPNSLW